MNRTITKLIVVTIMLFCLTSCKNNKPTVDPEQEHVHNWVDTITKKATCEEEGSLSRKCQDCSEVQTITLNKTAHSFDEGVITKEATCKEDGEIAFTCSTCSKTIEQSIPKVEHKVVVDLGYAPTCYTEGLSEGSHCEHCGEVIVEQETLQSTGHLWGKSVYVKKPTCESEGTTRITCEICKAVRENNVSKLEHNITYKEYTAPTCTVGGLIGAGYCEWCQKNVFTEVVLSPVGHNYIDGECIRCLEKESEDGMTFKLVNGEYYLADVGMVTTNNIVIPTMYNNSYVVGILEGALEKALYVNTICLSKYIHTIEDGAFSGCDYLQNFVLDPENPYYQLKNDCIIDTATNTLIVGSSNATIPDGVVTIASGAFKNRIGVTIIYIPSSVKEIAEDAFSGCSNISLISIHSANSVYTGKDNCIVEKASNTLLLGCASSSIPEGTVTIASGAFAGCNMLMEIEIPDSVTTIMPGAFTDCILVTKLDIPASVTQLEGAFEGFTALTTITIDEKNPKYSVIEGCIIDKTAKKLVLSNLEGYIPEGIEIIGKGVFAGNNNITNITLPDTIVEIEARAFAGCENLKTVTLSKNVKVLGDEVFDGCKKLEKIIIPDSVEELGARAFRGCEKLQRIELSEFVKVIEEEAFKDCTILLIVSEAKSKPSTWHENYNPDKRPEFWGVYIIN